VLLTTVHTSFSFSFSFRLSAR